MVKFQTINLAHDMDWCECFAPEFNSASATSTETGEAVVRESHFTTTDETSRSSEAFKEPTDVISVADREERNCNYDFDRHMNGFGASSPEKTPYAADCLQERTCFGTPSALMITKVHNLAFPRLYGHETQTSPLYPIDVALSADLIPAARCPSI